MSASFWLEMGFAVDSGAGVGTNTNNQVSGTAAPAGGGQGLTFNRRSTVSLAGNLGEVRVGRDYTPAFWSNILFDPLGGTGVGAQQVANSQLGLYPGIGGSGPVARASNSFGYFLPSNLGGFYGQAQYSLGENNQNGAATEKDGNGAGLRLGYAAGPVNVALAYGRTRYASGDVSSGNIAGSYDFGLAKLMALYARDNVAVPAPGSELNSRGGLVGVVVPVGVGQIKLAVSRYRTDAPTSPTTKKWALGYVHALSKRTALYTTYARLSNSGTATQALNGAVTTAGGSSTGYDIGIRHSF